MKAVMGIFSDLWVCFFERDFKLNYLKRVMVMFGGMGKNFLGLYVSFFKIKKTPGYPIYNYCSWSSGNSQIIWEPWSTSHTFQ